MKIAVSIDTGGFLVPGSETLDYQGQETFNTVILDSPIPDGFWHPRFNRQTRSWMEGLNSTQISDRINTTPEPPPAYLLREESTAININYLPTPENSVISGGNLQTALDQTITQLAQIKSEISLLKTSVKPPLFFDAINDVEGTSLDLHIPNNPYNNTKWQEVVGNWSISANQARSDGTTGSLAVYDGGVGSSGSFGCDVTIVDVATPQGIVFRYTSNTSYWRICFSKTSGGRWILYEITAAGTNTRVNIPAVGIVFGKTYNLKVILDNGNISFYLDEQFILSWTSLANVTATRVGFYASSSINTRFKNSRAILL